MGNPFTSGAIVLGSSGGQERSIVAHDQVFQNTQGSLQMEGLSLALLIYSHGIEMAEKSQAPASNCLVLPS